MTLLETVWRSDKAIQLQRALLKIAAVCTVAAVIGSMALAIVFRVGAQFPADVDWEKVGAMPYNDALSYMMDRTLNLSAWEAFRNAAPLPEFWLEIGQLWLMLFVFGFVCAAVSLWWIEVKRKAT